MPGTVQKPLVSVVMPVYNAGRYLNKALYTVTGQQYGRMEIICVDDGSTDNSVELLQKWKEKDARIRVIVQQNRGAGIARNIGMAATRGKYIVFLDADDVFHKQMIRELVGIAEKKNTDILIYGYYKFSGRKRIKTVMSTKALKIPMNKVISPRDISDRIFQADHGMPWNKFYRTEFVRKTGASFQALKNTEDEFFSRITTVEANRIMFLDKKYVGYRVNNPVSIQGQVNEGILDPLRALTAIHDELKKRGFYDIYYVTYQKLAFYLTIWRLKEKKEPEIFQSFAYEIATDTLKRCEIDGTFIDKQYRKLYHALKNEDIARAEFEMNRINKAESTICQRIKRHLKRLSVWV